jgi:hypothetical protein
MIQQFFSDFTWRIKCAEHTHQPKGWFDWGGDNCPKNGEQLFNQTNKEDQFKRKSELNYWIIFDWLCELRETA